MAIELVRGDITQVETEAIVNAANNQLWMGAASLERVAFALWSEEATA